MTYHAQANPTKRLNKTIFQRLAMAIIESSEDWDQIVSYTATVYNQTPHAAIGKSPYEQMFGRAPRLPASSPLQYVTTMANDDAVADQHLRMKAGWEAAAKLIEKGQVTQKEYYDRQMPKTISSNRGNGSFCLTRRANSRSQESWQCHSKGHLKFCQSVSRMCN